MFQRTGVGWGDIGLGLAMGADHTSFGSSTINHSGNTVMVPGPGDTGRKDFLPKAEGNQGFGWKGTPTNNPVLC